MVAATLAQMRRAEEAAQPLTSGASEIAQVEAEIDRHRGADYRAPGRAPDIRSSKIVGSSSALYPLSGEPLTKLYLSANMPEAGFTRSRVGADRPIPLLSRVGAHAILAIENRQSPL